MSNPSDQPQNPGQNRSIVRTLAIAAALLVGLSLTACTIDDSGNAPIKSAHKQKTKNGGGATKASEPSPDPGVRPTKDDIAVKFILKSKTCFGSVGCNIEYNVGVTWLGLGKPHLDDDYDVKYAVTGDESGPQIDTLTIHPNGKYDVPYGGVLSTPSSYTKPAAHVVSIRKHVGY